MSVLQKMIAEETARRDTEAARLKSIAEAYQRAINSLHGAFAPFAEEVATMYLRADFKQSMQQHLAQEYSKRPYTTDFGIYVAFATGWNSGTQTRGITLVVVPRTAELPLRVELKMHYSDTRVSPLATFSSDYTTAATMVEALFTELIKELA